MKKTMTLIVSLALAVAIGIGGTLAYLTDKSVTLTNTFTVGGLGITLDEPAWKDNAKIVPGAEIEKDPTVTVEANSEASYVFIKVTVDEAITAVLAENGINYNTATDEWIKLDNASGVATNEVVYYKAVEATEGSEVKLTPLFTTVTIDEDAANAAITAADGKNIVVVAYAIQQAGFENNVAGAWTTVLAAATA